MTPERSSASPPAAAMLDRGRRRDREPGRRRPLPPRERHARAARCCSRRSWCWACWPWPARPSRSGAGRAPALARIRLPSSYSPPRVTPPRRQRSVAALLLGAALAAVAFGAAGGTELTRTTVVEVLMVLGGSSLVAAAVLVGRRGPLYGGTAVTLFAALAALTALSVLWSVAPELAYVETGRTNAIWRPSRPGWRRRGSGPTRRTSS